MVTALAVLGVLLVLFVAAVLATRESPLLADAPPDEHDLQLPDRPLEPDDVRALRFSMAARGYRMTQVDAALERLRAELADRDRRIALLEAAAEGAEPPAQARVATPDDLPVTPEPDAPPAAGPTPPPIEPWAAQPSQPPVPLAQPSLADLPAPDLGTDLLRDPPPAQQPAPAWDVDQPSQERPQP